MRQSCQAHLAAATEELGAQRDGRAEPQQTALEDAHQIGKLIRLSEVVGGEKDRSALGPELRDEVEDEPGRHWVETGGRLVQEDHLGFMEQGSHDRELLAHAFGEAADEVVATLSEVEGA